ncbi:uncharacterized protein YhhL (DUF1145 family) [Pseudomonas fluvialis]|uniref:Uncharacterized protein YhhL (DUF1145 family) n=1 Tax=Pseudomonas fluvialis TaxID=1793966 RepID=A0A7X0ETQ3_9PSED|nr:DUF1145 domain-containing protein [Pseudomonas fluvialis]MBB6341314.1 uncharacterized protein YhhL (DUF1145 family) [Pseudomonas fluvialis]
MLWLRVVAHALVLLFWGLVLANLLAPVSQPFAGLLQLSGVAMLVLNLLAVAIHHQLLKQHPGSWLQRLLVLPFGALRLPAPGRAAEGFGAV